MRLLQAPDRDHLRVVFLQGLEAIEGRRRLVRQGLVDLLQASIPLLEHLDPVGDRARDPLPVHLELTRSPRPSRDARRLRLRNPVHDLDGVVSGPQAVPAVAEAQQEQTQNHRRHHRDVEERALLDRLGRNLGQRRLLLFLERPVLLDPEEQAECEQGGSDARQDQEDQGPHAGELDENRDPQPMEPLVGVERDTDDVDETDDPFVQEQSTLIPEERPQPVLPAQDAEDGADHRRRRDAQRGEEERDRHPPHAHHQVKRKQVGPDLGHTFAESRELCRHVALDLLFRVVAGDVGEERRRHSTEDGQHLIAGPPADTPHGQPEHDLDRLDDSERNRDAHEQTEKWQPDGVEVAQPIDDAVSVLPGQP